MKVGFVSQWFPPEIGSAALPGIIASALQARGDCDVQVITAFPNYPEGRLQQGWVQSWKHREVQGGLHVFRTPVYLSHNERALPRMLNYLSFAASATWTLLRQARDVDVVWVHGTPATVALPAMVLRATRGTPYVLHIQDLWPDTVMASGMLPHFLEFVVRTPLDWFCRLSYRYASVVGIITPGMRPILNDRGVPDEKILDLPNWANEELFIPDADGAGMRRELGLPTHFTAMYAGAVGEVQDLETIVRAAELLKHRSDIHFAIVGDGIAKTSLQRMAENLRLTNITFIPSQPLERMARVLAAADVQIVSLKDLPLYRITLPSKVQATLAAGRPMIVSAGGDAGEVVRAAGAGLAVEPGNPTALAQAVSKAADAGPETLVSWGEASRRHYETTFSESRGIRKMLTALNMAAHSRPDRR